MRPTAAEMYATYDACRKREMRQNNEMVSREKPMADLPMFRVTAEECPWNCALPESFQKNGAEMCSEFHVVGRNLYRRTVSRSGYETINEMQYPCDGTCGSASPW